MDQLYSYLRALALTIYFCPKYSSPGVTPAHSFISFMSFQSLCLCETLPIGWGQTHLFSYQYSPSPFCAFSPTALLFTWHIYPIYLSPKIVDFRKGMGSVSFDSRPSTPRTLEREEAPDNYLITDTSSED